MRRKIFALAVLTTIVLVFFFLWQPEKQAETDFKNPRHNLSEQSPLFARVKTDAVRANGTGQEGKLPPRVYKPTSLQVGEGAATVVEIDHGLRKVDLLKGEKHTEDVQKAKRKGALAAINLRVVDSAGNPVAGAELFGGFWNNEKNDPPATGMSDANGDIWLEHICTGDFNFSIVKDGYYKTSLRYWFFKTGYDCAKDGRWLPWNPTVEVVLKERRNPTKMLVKDVDIKLPLKNADYGFDFWVGDLVAPDGNGKVADIRVKCWGDKPYPPSRNFTNELLVVSASVGGGFVVKAKDKWSEFPSDYEAPENGYSESFHLSMKRSEIKIFENVELAETDYLIVKIVRGKAGGNGAGSWYGKIYGPLIYGIMTNDREGAGVKFSYYLNLTPDDRNLEAEGRYP